MVYTNEIIKEKFKKRDKIRKGIKIITTPFVILLLVIVCYVGYAKFIKQESNITLFGYNEYIVATGSMAPIYDIGDLIVVKKADKENIQLGDVITYLLSDGSQTVTHRVVELVEQDGETLYRTQGDNNNSPDPDLISYNQIKGEVVFKIEKAGIFISNLLSGAGITLIVIIVAILYLRSNSIEEKRIAREDARRLYNLPKYEKEEKAI